MDFELRETVETDVLVIGGGAAGLRAAIEASGKDRQVMILSQSRVGRSNNSAISLGGFSATLSGDKGEDSPRHHYEDTMAGGGRINRPFLVRTLTERVPSDVASLEKMGVQFQRDDEGNYVRVARGGHRLARRLSTPTNSGTALLNPLLKYAETLNLQRWEGLKVLRLLIEDSRIGGVLVLDREGKFSAISAKSVVLATGGCGALYPETTNVQDATGDGYALAYEAGLTLQDMEFVQFVIRNLPEAGIPRRLPPAEFLLIKGARLRNDLGEDLLAPDGTTRSFTRDIVTRAVAREMLKRGEGGYVVLDLSPVPEEELNKLGRFEKFAVKMIPASHFFMGGIRVDENLCTPIRGLYAAGEVVGGVHGANRLAGNALAETFVFGTLAGTLAARFADSDGKESVFNRDQAKEAIERVTESFGKSQESPGRANAIPEMDEALKKIVGECAGPVRSQAMLEEGLRRLKALKDDLSGFSIAGDQDAWPLLAFSNKLTVSEIILKSALKREESRGAHFREDYPDLNDDQWRVNICVTKDDDEKMKLSIEPVE